MRPSAKSSCSPRPHVWPRIGSSLRLGFGTTEDVIESIEFAKAKGAYTIGFTGFADSPFAKALDVALVTEPKTWPFDIPMILLSTRLLAVRGEFEGYEELASELQTLPRAWWASRGKQIGGGGVCREEQGR